MGKWYHISIDKLGGDGERWPKGRMLTWCFVEFVCSMIILGIFCQFITVQKRLHAPQPWHFAFIVVTCLLTIALVVFFLVTIASAAPQLTLILVTALFLFQLTGLIKSSLELFGVPNSTGQPGIQTTCQTLILGDNNWGGPSVATLARLQEVEICRLWQCAWALQLISTLAMLFMILVSYEAYRASTVLIIDEELPPEMLPEEG